MDYRCAGKAHKIRIHTCFLAYVDFENRQKTIGHANVAARKDSATQAIAKQMRELTCALA